MSREGGQFEVDEVHRGAEPEAGAHDMLDAHIGLSAYPVLFRLKRLECPDPSGSAETTYGLPYIDTHGTWSAPSAVARAPPKRKPDARARGPSVSR